MFDFDTVIDRKNTFSLKYDFNESRGYSPDTLPFWIADMDFKTAPCITETLAKAVSHGIFGYSDADDSYFEAVYHWFRQNFRWEVKQDWLVKTSGVVPALHAAVRAFTKPDYAVLIQPPVYQCFASAIETTGRRVVKSPLIRRGKKYSMNDFDDIERKIVENNVKLSLLCSPQNPTGRVWTREELSQYSAICRRHHVRIVVDEIHCDFTYPGYTHTAFGTLGEEDAMNAVICTAPTKTFNISGLQDANIWIPNPAMREAFRKELIASGAIHLNLMGLIAGRAAYLGGKPWLDALKEYLLRNLNYVRSFLNANLPYIKLVEPEGTYLLWLDFRYYGLTDAALELKLRNDAHLWVNMGNIFGSEGSGYVRLNIACPRSTLEKGMNRLYEAFKSQKPSSNPYFL